MKKPKRTPKPISVPMIINRDLQKNVETLQEHSMLLMFKLNLATKDHFDYLQRLANMMNISNQLKESASAANLYNALTKLAKDIHKHFQTYGVFKANEKQLKVMTDCVNFYDSYWKAYSTLHYNECAAELNAFYADTERSI